MSDTDFIGVYPKILDSEFCRHLMDKFNASGDRTPGVTVHGVDHSKKDSSDIRISGHPAWEQETAHIVRRTILGLIPYVRQHPFTLVGATSINTAAPETGERVAFTHDDIADMSDPQIAELILKVYRLGSINLQKYEQNTGGYHHWHSEICPSPQDPECEAMHRVLLWMYYLNDVEEGGETEIFYQQKKVKPRQGCFVVAPTSFTHTHKGHIPKSNDKYILTSWVLYQRAETMFGK
jgi:hypothetical protein